MINLRSFFLIASLAMAAFTFSSCSEENGGTQPTPSTPTPTASCRIMKADFFGTELSFTYDANNKVISIADPEGFVVNAVHAGDSIVITPEGEEEQLRFVVFVANNRVVRTKEIEKFGDVNSQGDSSINEIMKTSVYNYNAANYLTSINTTERTIDYAFGSNRIIDGPFFSVSSKTLNYTNNALTSINEVSDEGNFAYNVVPSTTKISNKNTLLFMVYEEILGNVGIIFAPPISLGEFMPARVSGSSRPSPTNFEYKVDDRANITEVKFIDENSSITSSFSYNCN